MTYSDKVNKSKDLRELILSLEDGDEFMLETGDVRGDSISRISVTPTGGKDADVDPSGKFDSDTTITIFNPAIDSDPETGVDS